MNFKICPSNRRLSEKDHFVASFKNKSRGSLRSSSAALLCCLNLLSSLHTIISEFVCPANQHPKYTIKKEKAHKPLRTSCISPKCLPCLIIIQSCYFDRINKPFACSRYVICVSCSVHVTSTYYMYVCKGSCFFYINYPQTNEVGKSDHMASKSFPYLHRPPHELRFADCPRVLSAPLLPPERFLPAPLPPGASLTP